MPEGFDRGVRDFATPRDYQEYERVARGTVAQALVDQISDLNATGNTYVRPALASRDVAANDGSDDSAVSEALVTTGDPEWNLTISGADYTAGRFGFYHFDNNTVLEDKTAILYGYEYLGNSGNLEDNGYSAQPFEQIEWVLPQGGLLAEHDINHIEMGEEAVHLIEDPMVVKKTDLYGRIVLGEDISASSDGNTYEVYIRPLIAVAEENGETYTDAPRYYMIDDESTNGTNRFPQKGHQQFVSMGDMLTLERAARNAAADKLISQVESISSRGETFARPIVPDEDLNGYDTYSDPSTPSWTVASGDLTADSWVDWYAFDNDDRMEDKSAVIYGYELVGDTTPVTAARWTLPQGGLLAEHDLSGLQTGVNEDEGHVVMLQDPLVVGKTDVYSELYAIDDTNDVTIRLLAQVGEETDETYTEAGNYYLTGRQNSAFRSQAPNPANLSVNL